MARTAGRAALAQRRISTASASAGRGKPAVHCRTDLLKARRAVPWRGSKAIPYANRAHALGKSRTAVRSNRRVIVVAAAGRSKRPFSALSRSPFSAADAAAGAVAAKPVAAKPVGMAKGKGGGCQVGSTQQLTRFSVRSNPYLNKEKVS